MVSQGNVIPDRVWGYPVMVRADLAYTLVAGPFRADRRLFHRNFDWPRVVNNSFYNCMQPVFERFQVVT